MLPSLCSKTLLIAAERQEARGKKFDGSLRSLVCTGAWFPQNNIKMELVDGLEPPTC